ncbi:solute carrier family 23 member 2-like [Ruditapes philippinarum]|uniref:solute carrier family 23 member 2-like n=1 Tax=Ruditapes philippinarum TaxID=129788 RepID=UPI00295AF980|nr:solute carrier family 23 member 2-like [Ruditapes philippinarum]XP_060587641.1 solute carrier family 23 member 2-like [Ruditapes philippinarum]
MDVKIDKDTVDEIDESVTAPGAVLYGVEDVPSPILCFLFGLQQAIMCIGGTLSIPFIMSGLICVGDRTEVTATLLSITMFMCGVATIIQTLFGIRLGIIQGGSHTFVAPIVAMMAVDKWRCPEESIASNGTDADEIWKSRMREIQGNLVIASITQLFLGCTGLIGVLLQFIGPLTIAPTISLIGLSLTGVVIEFNKYHWGIAFLAMSLTLLFTLYLGKLKLPLPAWSTKRACHFEGFPIFQLFPVILSICFSWLFCLMLTVTDVLPNNSTLPSFMARTDARIGVLERSPWFYWPYPFQFGTPTVSAAGYVAFLAATIASIIESVGDYYAAARISGAPPPPPHAINRGIAMEGLSSIVSGLVGAGHGTTSYSGNIGAIGITKVASRAVFLTAGIILLLCGVVGKFGAVLTLIPDPVIGGTLTVMFGMVSAVGISTLKFIDLDSTRNLTILGVSLILGLMVPQYINNPANANLINTGNEELDQVIKVLLGTAMFVGGFVGFLLDNTVPGSYEERGILSWRKNLLIRSDGMDPNQSLQIYEYPYVTKYLRQVKCCTYIPVSPVFNKEITAICSCCSSVKNRNSVTKTGYDNQAATNDVEIEVTFSKENGVKL